MLPVPPSVLYNSCCFPSTEVQVGSGEQVPKLLLLSHHQWGSVDPHKKGRQLWAPLIHPCFQETSKAAKILKQIIERPGCRLCKGPVAFGCEWAEIRNDGARGEPLAGGAVSVPLQPHRAGRRLWWLQPKLELQAISLSPSSGCSAAGLWGF